MNFSSIISNRVVTASVVTATVAFAPVFGAIAQAETLNGAGATFPAPLYQVYAREVRKKHPDLSINYQGIGSGAGIRQMIAGTLDFGASDAAMKDSEIAKVKNGVILVPTAGGAVSVVYNVPGVTNLRISRTVLPEIFSGQITKWNDRRIKADNPGVNLPNLPIKFVVRADGSGTTFIFTNHLSAVSPYFKGRVGASTEPRWTLPNVLKGKGNPGVAALVARTSGSIGYVEYDYALQNRLRSAVLQNKGGQYVSPSLRTANEALASVKFPANFRVFVGEPDKGYPIVGMTWMMVYKHYADSSKAQAIKEWINWVLTDGQKLNGSLNYSRVPENVAERVMQVVNSDVK